MPQPLIIREQGASVMTFKSGASLNFESGAAFKIGNANQYSGTAIPVFSASPGAVYWRSDGSASNMFINVSSGTTGSVWKSASIFDYS